MLDFRIYTFLAVCKHMNYTKAAKELCITQPAVSQHIKYLETNYQTKLFHYEGKKLVLTQAGILLYKSLLTIVYDEQLLKKRMLQNNQPVTALNLGATRTIGEFYLTNKLSRFISMHPEIQLTMIVENTSCLLEKLQNGEIECAFLEGYFPKTEYNFVKYARENYICVSGKDYSRKKAPRLLEDLLSETLIIREAGSGTRAILEKNLEKEDLMLTDFNRLIEVGNIHILKDFVTNNVGITMLYESAVTEELNSGQIEKIEIENLQKTHDFYFVWRKNSIFSDFYQQIAQEL